MADSVELRIQDHCAELVLNQPEKRNALNSDMWRIIPERIAQAKANSGVRVIILHGGETGNFAAGADISEFADAYANEDRIRASGNLISEALNAIEASEIPVIAAINGPCFGAGVSLAAAADFRIAHVDATFCIPPAKLGLVYPAGDTRRLIALIGPGATKALTLTARIIGAQEAKNIGLVEILSETNAIVTARETARQMAALSPHALRSIKAMTSLILAGADDNAAATEALFVSGFLSADHAEGRAAFLQKRKAVFTGA